MSIIPSIFGGRRSNVFDPFSLDLWDPFQDLPISVSRPELSNETTQFANTRIDWKETPDSHVFEADLPGVNKEEVKVEMEEGNVLQISGERRKESEEVVEMEWHRVECSSGKFLKGGSSCSHQVKAAMENGVLTVIVPKEEVVKKPETKAIEISG